LGAAAGTGALGATAAAAAPVVAVVVVGGAAIYGAWQFGEWTARQPWNPFTRPRDLPQPRAVPKCDSPPKAIPLPPPPPDNDFCYKRWLAEDAQCGQWRKLGWRAVSACKERASIRRNLCVRNGGRPNPLSHLNIVLFVTIHVRKKP
jgi:hypothetical protein